MSFGDSFDARLEAQPGECILPSMLLQAHNIPRTPISLGGCYCQYHIYERRDASSLRYSWLIFVFGMVENRSHEENAV